MKCSTEPARSMSVLALDIPPIASDIRTSSIALQSSNQFPYRPRIVFGRFATCRNLTVPANRLSAVGPMPRCKASRPTTLQTWRQGRLPKQKNAPYPPPPPKDTQSYSHIPVCWRRPCGALAIDFSVEVLCSASPRIPAAGVRFGTLYGLKSDMARRPLCANNGHRPG